MSQYDWAILAQLVRPQGRHGEIIADLLTDFPERFAERKHLYLVASETSGTPVREVTLESHWMHKGRVVLKFSGVDSIDDAEALRSLLVAIPSDERAPLADDSVYISDLIGCDVIDVASSPLQIGTVRDLDREAGLLIVQPARGEEILIPFAKTYLVNIDTRAKRIEMRLPEGLLDINAPITDEERRAEEDRQALDTGADAERS
ncbi:MAG TPA: ribosome maturation factor RimM [Silvibacterium sp.]|jgi:16S rRNA processing protein RimM|nr:ribosome maturation factor RimM [Silvibacterium sp.]